MSISHRNSIISETNSSHQPINIDQFIEDNEKEVLKFAFGKSKKVNAQDQIIDRKMAALCYLAIKKRKVRAEYYAQEFIGMWKIYKETPIKHGSGEKDVKFKAIIAYLNNRNGTQISSKQPLSVYLNRYHFGIVLSGFKSQILGEVAVQIIEEINSNSFNGPPNKNFLIQFFSKKDIPTNNSDKTATKRFREEEVALPDPKRKKTETQQVLMPPTANAAVPPNLLFQPRVNLQPPIPTLFGKLLANNHVPANNTLLRPLMAQPIPSQSPAVPEAVVPATVATNITSHHAPLPTLNPFIFRTINLDSPLPTLFGKPLANNHVPANNTLLRPLMAQPIPSQSPAVPEAVVPATVATTNITPHHASLPTLNPFIFRTINLDSPFAPPKRGFSNDGIKVKEEPQETRPKVLQNPKM